MPLGKLMILTEEVSSGGNDGTDSKSQKIILVVTTNLELLYLDIGVILAVSGNTKRQSDYDYGMTHIAAEKVAVNIWYGNDGNLEAKQKGCL